MAESPLFHTPWLPRCLSDPPSSWTNHAREHRVWSPFPLPLPLATRSARPSAACHGHRHGESPAHSTAQPRRPAQLPVSVLPPSLVFPPRRIHGGGIPVVSTRGSEKGDKGVRPHRVLLRGNEKEKATQFRAHRFTKLCMAPRWSVRALHARVFVEWRVFRFVTRP